MAILKKPQLFNFLKKGIAPDMEIYSLLFGMDQETSGSFKDTE
jgi:hypothetical protein